MNPNTPPAALAPWATCCPLCGQPNQCAVALGQAPQSCWCMGTAVNPVALAALPQAERGQRCICPVCAQGPEGLSS